MPPANGKKKKKNGSKEPSQAQLQMQDLAKRFWLGYQKRLVEAKQQPISCIEQGVKAAIKDPQTPFVNIVLDGISLLVENSPVSRLEPLFTSLLATGFPYLKELYLWNLTLTSDDTMCLSTYLQQRRDFTTLEILGCNFCDSKGLRNIAVGIGFNKSITTLKLSNTKLNTEDLRIITLELSHNETLRSLEFVRCDLNHEVGQLLFQYISAVPLQKINLEGNNLGAKGLKDLSKVFSCSDVLQEVLLPENGIDVDECSEDDMRMAVEALCANLMHTNSLKMLDLSYNTFGDDYGEMILNLLKSRKEQGLCSLTVKVGHRMSSAIFSAIAAECKASKKKKKATKKKKGGKKKK